ncbi:MAG: penicillin-binding protein activator [Alphaproteobacteria bacterium HGW-Alphaproteobacteria-2]|nr:MAG: penicillin-binding protein activator [Alphaproteobacteria bacterium HGW-Alphaproteobacteria-2]
MPHFPIRSVGRLRRLFMPLAAVLALAACDAGPTGEAPPVSRGAVSVALLVPLDSSDLRTRAVAASLENAARLAISDLNGVRVDLQVYRTDGTPGRAAEAARAAAAAGADVLLGPLFADAARAAGAAVAGDGIQVLAFSNNPEAAGGNVFLLGTSFRNTAERLVGYAAMQGRNRILVVHERTRSGEVGRDAAQAAIARAGATLTGIVGHEFTQDGVVAVTSEAVETARASQTNAVLFTADAAGALPLLSQLLPEAGLRAPEVQFLGLTRWDIPSQTLTLPGVQGGWFTLPDPELAAAFAARYAAGYGTAPHSLAALAYDGIAAIAALAAQDGAVSAAALTQPAGFAGANGAFRFHPDGTSTRALAVATIENSQVVVLDPAPRRFDAAGL